jgi:hypothetical protein
LLWGHIRLVPHLLLLLVLEPSHHPIIEHLLIVWILRLLLLTQIESSHLSNHLILHHVHISVSTEHTLEIAVHHRVHHVLHLIHIKSTHTWLWHLVVGLWHSVLIIEIIIVHVVVCNSKVIVSVSVRTVVTEFALAMVFEMSAFHRLVVGTSTTLSALVVGTEVILVLVSVVVIIATSALIIIITASLTHVCSTRATTISSTISSSHSIIATASTTVHLLVKATSLILLLEFAYLMLFGFQGNCHLFWGHWVVWFPQLLLTVCEMAFVA